MKTIDVKQSKPTIEELLKLVQDGDEVLLTNGDTPLARLSPIETEAKPRILGLHPGIWTSDDFNEPLSDEFWLGEE